MQNVDKFKNHPALMAALNRHGKSFEDFVEFLKNAEESHSSEKREVTEETSSRDNEKCDEFLNLLDRFYNQSFEEAKAQNEEKQEHNFKSVFAAPPALVRDPASGLIFEVNSQLRTENWLPMKEKFSFGSLIPEGRILSGDCEITHVCIEFDFRRFGCAVEDTRFVIPVKKTSTCGFPYCRTTLYETEENSLKRKLYIACTLHMKENLIEVTVRDSSGYPVTGGFRIRLVSEKIVQKSEEKTPQDLTSKRFMFDGWESQKLDDSVVFHTKTAFGLLICRLFHDGSCNVQLGENLYVAHVRQFPEGYDHVAILVHTAEAIVYNTCCDVAWNCGAGIITDHVRIPEIAFICAEIFKKHK